MSSISPDGRRSTVVMPVSETVASAIGEAGLSSSDRLVVGLSGGVDSLALTIALLQFERSGVGPRIFPVHVDHRLRPDSSDAARSVAELGVRLGREIQVVVVDVDAWDGVLRQGIEGSARAARYAALTEAATAAGTSWLSVAHNADDQAESVLLALCRGASTGGLAGMSGLSTREVSLDPAGKRHARINLVRPMLGLRRTAIEEFLQAMGLEPIEDPSNRSMRYQRNALRHNLMPLLERTIPGAIEAINRSAGRLAADEAFIDDLASRAHDEVGLRLVGDCRLLRRSSFGRLPEPIQHRIIWSVLRQLNDSGKRIKQERVEAARRRISGPGEGQTIEIVDDLVLYLDYELAAIGPRETLFEKLRQESGRPLLPPWMTCELTEGERKLELAGETVLKVELHPGNRFEPRRWQVRTRRQGDRVGPSNTMSLQDLMVDRRVPRYVRDWTPLVVSGSSILWIGGVSPAPYTSDDGALTIRLEKAPDAITAVGDDLG